MGLERIKKMINDTKNDTIRTLKKIIDEIKSDNVVIHDFDLTKMQKHNKSFEIQIILSGHTKKD